MEEKIPQEFQQVFRSLVVAFQPRSLDRDAMRVYHGVLGELPAHILRSSAEELARTNKFFPTTGEWFQAAAQVQREALRNIAASPISRRVECERCSDTGSVYVECPGDSTCGRQHEHRPHSFVCVCACRPTNRSYQRQRASQVLLSTTADPS